MLEIKNLCKNYGKIEVLKHISLSLKRGEILSIMGESGSGKSTLLRCIAGLESAKFDEFKCAGEVGLLFQNYALFPHLNVAQNIEFALHHLDKKARKERVNELLKRFEIEGLASKKIDAISGGQAQRVAFARAVAKGASLLLLDEPFSNLDQNLKESLRSELKILLKSAQITAIMVTHDINDAYFLSDKIALLSRGEFIDYNSPKELFYHPKSAQSALMLGGLNVVDLKELKNKGFKNSGEPEKLKDSSPENTKIQNGEPENAKFQSNEPRDSDAFFEWLRRKNGIFAYSELVLGTKFSAKILEKLFLGDFYKLKLDYRGVQFYALFPSNLEFKDAIEFDFKP